MRPTALLAGVSLVAIATSAVPVRSQQAPEPPRRTQEWAFADWRSDPERAEEFLRSAEVVAARRLPIGVTRPWRLTLELDGVRADASFKTIDEFRQKMQFEDGSFDLLFRDSYQNELAAYELDKLLGLGLVPPTVERRAKGDKGAARLWIEGAISEAERSKQGIQAPDPIAWSDQVAVMRLFFSLTANSDYNNINNVLIDGDFMICAIDHSRAFQVRRTLVGEAMLTRFPRPLLAELEALDATTLRSRLGGWLSKQRIRTLLDRRDRILRLVDEMIERKGEELVLFD